MLKRFFQLLIISGSGFNTIAVLAVSYGEGVYGRGSYNGEIKASGINWPIIFISVFAIIIALILIIWLIKKRKKKDQPVTSVHS